MLRAVLLGQLDDHGAEQQDADEVRDRHEAVEGVGDVPHQLEVGDRAGDDDEAEESLIGADDLAAEEELRAAGAVERPAEDGALFAPAAKKEEKTRNIFADFPLQ